MCARSVRDREACSLAQQSGRREKEREIRTERAEEAEETWHIARFRRREARHADGREITTTTLCADRGVEKQHLGDRCADRLSNTNLFSACIPLAGLSGQNGSVWLCEAMPPGHYRIGALSALLCVCVIWTGLAAETQGNDAGFNFLAGVCVCVISVLSHLIDLFEVPLGSYPA